MSYTQNITLINTFPISDSRFWTSFIVNILDQHGTTRVDSSLSGIPNPLSSEPASITGNLQYVDPAGTYTVEVQYYNSSYPVDGGGDHRIGPFYIYSVSNPGIPVSAPVITVTGVPSSPVAPGSPVIITVNAPTSTTITVCGQTVTAPTGTITFNPTQTTTCAVIATGPGGTTTTPITILVSTAPILGCTDPSATNYNSAATQNDGSCTYAPVVPVVDLCACDWQAESAAPTVVWTAQNRC